MEVYSFTDRKGDVGYFDFCGRSAAGMEVFFLMKALSSLLSQTHDHGT